MTTSIEQVRRRRLSVPGTTVHLEPIPSREPVPAGEKVSDKEDRPPRKEGRPLREPRPEAAPYGGPSSEAASSQDISPRDISPRDTSSRDTSLRDTSPQRPFRRGAAFRPGSAQAELFPRPRGDSSVPGRLMAGVVDSGTGLAHRWLRQRGLFAELRALERSERALEGSERALEGSREAGEDTGDSTGDAAGKVGRGEGAGGAGKIGRGEVLSIRLSRVQAALLAEAVACSRYRSRSAYLRAVATGRDRRGPILAKAGVLFLWARTHFGEPIRLEEQEELGRLGQFLFGTEDVGEMLALIRRHLRAARLAASGRLGGAEGLPPVPKRVQQRVGSGLSTEVSTRVCRERKRLIRENAAYSAYSGMSGFIRHVALGWDRNGEILARCAAIAEWMEGCLKGQVDLEGQVGPEDWKRLDGETHRRFGVYLSGPGASGRVDVEGALRRGARHLLGAAPETFASRVPAEL